MVSTARFIRQFLRPRPGAILEEATSYRRGDRSLPATLFRPADVRDPLPGWVTLHGLTYRGREHATLRRFAASLAASGAAVLVPDLPEWRALLVAPGAAVETIKSAVLALDRSGAAAPGRIGVMGFSFGATQALIASTDPALEGHLAGVAAWGGYGDMRRVTRFMFTGDHRLDGQSYHIDPDPYGRWIVAGNYLGLLPEFDEGGPLTTSLLGLAREAGERGIRSWDPAMDPFKASARRGLAGRDREVFDLIAPPTGTTLDPDARDRLASLVERTLDRAVEREPLLEPAPYLDRVPVPVFLAHGRDDRLIPWTEMLRLRRALPPELVKASGVTALFAHSTGERRLPSPGLAVEGVRFVRLLRSMLRLI
jgi:acetyl esterase/lipase